LQIYHDITGNIGSPQDPNVSISPGFREAAIHLVVVPSSTWQTKGLYKLGPNSYFSESAYEMDDIKIATGDQTSNISLR